jgi:hypothetical protein
MANGILDIDHVMCQVADTEQARTTFERLGFRASPRSSIANGGVANRLLMFTPKGDGVANFIELMQVEDRGRLESQMADVLAGAPGIKSLVNALDDADTARSGHTAAGFAMLDVWPKERTWRLPSGEELLFAFRVLLPAPHQVPLMFNGVEYLTLHHYLRPEFQRHPNGALRWTRVSAVIDDDRLDDAVAVYERLYGSSAERGDGQATIAVRDTSLRLLTPEGLVEAYGEIDLSGFQPPSYCAITLEVTDVRRAGAILEDNGVRHVRHTNSIVIDPDEACGTVLEFVAQAGTPSTHLPGPRPEC